MPADSGHDDHLVIPDLLFGLIGQVDQLLLTEEGKECMEKREEAGKCYEFNDDDDDNSRLEARSRGDEVARPLLGLKLRQKRKSAADITAAAASESHVPTGESHAAAATARSQFKRTRTCASARVGYVFSPELIRECGRLPKVRFRSHLVHELICAYKLPSHMLLIKSRPATRAELRSFHSETYIDYVETLARKGTGAGEDGLLDTTVTGEDFGLGYDCPAFDGMFETMSEVAGSSLSAVEALMRGDVSIAINWCGGWHHASVDEASGFCYVNDVVISILKLLDAGYTRVLYVDFDLHHGDAVEHAFAHSNKVLSVSFHKFELGFFPGTGDIHDVGSGKGKGYCINVPFKDGLTDDKFMMVTREVLSEVRRFYDPEVIVAQFGADGITGDPMNSFNLTPKSMVHCLSQLKGFHVPLLLLGGGGYNSINTAKCWTQVTAAACQVDLANDIPDHRNFLKYGPNFELDIPASLRKDFNSFDDLKHTVRQIQHRLSLQLHK